MSSWSGSVLGGDEVFILTEKVIKGNIKIRFFQVSNSYHYIRFLCVLLSRSCAFLCGSGPTIFRMDQIFKASINFSRVLFRISLDLFLCTRLNDNVSRRTTRRSGSGRSWPTSARGTYITSTLSFSSRSKHVLVVAVGLDVLGYLFS